MVSLPSIKRHVGSPIRVNATLLRSFVSFLRKQEPSLDPSRSLLVTARLPSMLQSAVRPTVSTYSSLAVVLWTFTQSMLAAWSWKSGVTRNGRIVWAMGPPIGALFTLAFVLDGPRFVGITNFTKDYYTWHLLQLVAVHLP